MNKITEFYIPRKLKDYVNLTNTLIMVCIVYNAKIDLTRDKSENKLNINSYRRRILFIRINKRIIYTITNVIRTLRVRVFTWITFWVQTKSKRYLRYYKLLIVSWIITPGEGWWAGTIGYSCFLVSSWNIVHQNGMLFGMKVCNKYSTTFSLGF